jgi:outer membrane protein assembly factor BamB
MENSMHVSLVVALALPSAAVGQTYGQTESPMFRGDPAHTGVVATRGLTSAPRVAWRFRTQGAVRSTPALVDGVLFFGSSDGHFYAVGAEDGSERWRFDAGSPISSSAAVDGSLVLFADRTNTITALDRTTGALVWQRATGPDRPLEWGHEGWDYITASPVIAPGTDGESWAIVGSGDGTVYGLRVSTGAIVWRHETERRIRATPAVVDGTVFIGSGDGLFYALDLATGTPRWTYRTAGVEFNSAEFGFDRKQIMGSAAVRDGTVYFGSRDASLYALDAATGQLRWHREDGSSWVMTSPAVSDAVLVNGRSSSTNVRALDPATGDERWVVETGALIFSSPTLVGDAVYLGDGAGWVHAFDVATGGEQWRFLTDGGIYSTPVVADGRLYIGSDDGNLYALESGPTPAPMTAVYFDNSLTAASLWGSAPPHRRLTDYFESYGYAKLDAGGLTAFLGARIEDRVPSVVVFGMDALPPAVTEGPVESTLFRRYLESGGKLVWLGYPPLLFIRDSTGQITGVDREQAGAFTGVDLTAWDSDSYPSHATEAGRRWGIEQWWIESPSADPNAVDEVLSMTETGFASAWVKGFGGPPGTGLVMLPADTREQRLEEIRRIAEFGILSTYRSGGP